MLSVWHIKVTDRSCLRREGPPREQAAPGISAQFIRRLTPCEGLFYRRCDNVTALAAVRIASITTLGLESIGTWLLSTS